MSHTPCGSSADVFVPPPRLSVLCLCSVSLFCVSVLCLSVLCLCSVSLFCVSVLCLSAVLSLCSLCSISLFCLSVLSLCTVSLLLYLSVLSLLSLSLSLSLLVSYPRLYTRHITINADCTHGMSLQITPTDPVTRGVQGRCTRSRCCSAYPRGAGPSPTQPRACSSS